MDPLSGRGSPRGRVYLRRTAVDIRTVGSVSADWHRYDVGFGFYSEMVKASDCTFWHLISWFGWIFAQLMRCLFGFALCWLSAFFDTFLSIHSHLTASSQWITPITPIVAYEYYFVAVNLLFGLIAVRCHLWHRHKCCLPIFRFLQS